MIEAVVPPDPFAGWYRIHWGRTTRQQKCIEVQTRAELDAAISKLRAGHTATWERARLHTCSACGGEGPWTETWGWYGSYLDLDNGLPMVKLCSEPCWPLAQRMGLIPRNASKADAEGSDR